MTEQVAVAEPFVAGTTERRMIRDPVLDAQAAEPAIGQVDLDLPTQRALRADRKQVADEQHPQHQHRIDRGPPHPGVMRRQLRIDPLQIEHRRDLADRVIVRHGVSKAERVEKLPLILVEPPHHCAPPQKTVLQTRNHRSTHDLNRLLQQNRHLCDIARQRDDVR